MKNINNIILIIAIAVLSSCDSKKTENVMETTTSVNTPLFPKGEAINNDYFSGTAWLNMLVTNKEDFDLTIGNVVFEAGVRNNWHSHPGGQILICTKGTGYYQEKGKPIWLLNVGDVVEILPDVVHWHGASPDSEFEHIAISTQLSKGAVVWLEPVTEEEYSSYKK